jgi:hypothetical protein
LTQRLKPLPFAAGLVAIIGILVGLNLGRLPKAGSSRSEVRRLRHRFKRPIFVVYVSFLIAGLIGGALYAPGNYDGLSYRTPQLLHWLSESGWHWIITPNSRYEHFFPWVQLADRTADRTSGTDRISFVVNLLGFALLPGLVFEMLRRAGSQKCVAWWWMWLIPSAYVFATQAGALATTSPGRFMVWQRLPSLCEPGQRAIR